MLKKIGFICLIAVLGIQGTCRLSLKDVSIPPEVKTVKVNFIENKARYINPQLSPRLTDKLRQKIINQTRLSQVSGEADYEISGQITDYSVSTSGISNQRSLRTIFNPNCCIRALTILIYNNFWKNNYFVLTVSSAPV